MNLSAGETQIRYCPRCAAGDLRWPSRKNFLCPSCGFTLYLNVAAAVAVIIESQGKILFGIRKNDPKKGMLDLPGGFVDPGETAEECARREVREETGLELGRTSFLTSFPNSYLYRQITYDTLDIVLTVSFDTLPEARAGDDLADVVWIERNSIDYGQIAFSSLRAALRYYLSDFPPPG